MTHAHAPKHRTSSSSGSPDVHGMSTGGKIAAAAVVAAVIAGTFLMTGTRGKKNRAAMRGWVLQAKGEVLERLEKLKEINMEAYLDIVESVLQRYRYIKDVTPEEIAFLRNELRTYWDEMLEAGKKKKGRGRGKK